MRLIRRTAGKMLGRLTREFPAVALVGPRQAGKTTLARTSFPRAQYWDFDRAADRARLDIAPEESLRAAKSPTVLDEAQRMPDIFPTLRSVIDERRKSCGRFLILGSASPDLVHGISETLAGRIAFLELTPLRWREVSPNRGIRLDRLWFRGGFPDAFLARSDAAWQRWMEQYVRTFIERDLGVLGVDVPASRLHRFSKLIAHLHGGMWNASEAGSSLGISYHTAQRYAEILEQAYLIRLLPPWHANLGKRLVKHPKIYWRDSGLLHFHLGLTRSAEILSHPKAGASWEGFVIENILDRERESHPASEAFFFRTHTGLECDLLLARGRMLVPIEIKLADKPDRSDVAKLRAVMKLLNAGHGHLLSRITRTVRTRDVTVWNIADLLTQKRWIG